MRTKFSWAIVLFLIFAASGVTQDYRGRIEGLVTDPSKAVIAGSTVTLLNVNTGVKVVRQTSETGLYLFDLVDPGTYSVTIESPGFSRFIQENIVVQTRGDVTVNAVLAPARCNRASRWMRHRRRWSSTPPIKSSPSTPRWPQKYLALIAIPSN